MKDYKEAPPVNTTDALIKGSTHHTEVEGLVAESTHEILANMELLLVARVDPVAIATVWETLKPIIEDIVTTHGAKERGEGFNEGMKAVRCQTAEEAYERGRGDGMGLVSNALRAEYGDFMGDGIRVGKVLYKLGILTPQTDVTKN